MRKPFLATALLLATSIAFAADEPKSIPWEETGPFKHVDGTGPHRSSHELLKHHRNRAKLAAAPSAVSQDVGDVAVIVDNGAIIIQPRPARPIDLTEPTKLSFVPAAPGGFAVSFAAPGLDPTIGGDLALGDDDTTEVALLSAFPFLGVDYGSIFVNSDGNVTFGAGDSTGSARDAARLIGGSPRVAPLLADLDPSSAGSIHADVRASSVVITWMDVAEFGTTNSNTFQVTLEASGNISMAYGSLDATKGVVGVAEGNNEGPFNEIDLTADLPGTFEAGAIFEEFEPAILVKQMDIFALAQEFYRTHPDEYDFLVMYSDFVVDLGFDAFAFHHGVQNQTSGIGVPIFDFSSIAGSDGELESILSMNSIGLYWPDAEKLEDPPISKFQFAGGAALNGPPGADQISRRARKMGTLQGDFGDHGSYTMGLNSAMSIMGQEAGHRWLAYVPFVHPTKGIGFDSLDLLGRGFSHWSFFFNVRVPDSQFGGDPRASSSEGNAILDLGPFSGCEKPGEHLFLTDPDELTDGYTELDQYLIGLRLAGDVGSFWYVDEPTSVSTGASVEGFRGVAPLDDRDFCGMRVNLSVADIQAFPGIGPRIPAIGDEVDEDADGNPVLDVKTMAFILLVEEGPPSSAAHASAIRQVDNFRRTWQTYANGKATGGLGRFDTSLSPAIH